MIQKEDQLGDTEDFAISGSLNLLNMYPAPAREQQRLDLYSRCHHRMCDLVLYHEVPANR